MENHIAIEENKQDKGFTLVELLIVIVILGILATVTVFAVQGITTRGKETACRADKKTLVTAIEAHQADLGTYPVDTGATTWSALEAAGLLADNAVSSNFIYDHTPAVVGPPAVAESYTVTVDPAGECVGVALT